MNQSVISQLLRLAIPIWVGSLEAIKILYVATCDCRAVGQPFNAWFFPAFQHLPYSFWWTFHGLTWLAGPYSLLWWGLNSPAVFGYWAFFPYILAVDFSAFVLLYPKNRGYALYLLTLNLWFTTLDPVDFFPILFAVLGRYRWWMLALAPIVKLPFGAPLWVWRWVLTSSDSLQGPENYSRYLLLGTVWTTSLLLYLANRYHLSLPIHHTNRLDRTATVT